MPTSKSWKELGNNSKRDSVDIAADSDTGRRASTFDGELPNISTPVLKQRRPSIMTASSTLETILPDINESGQTSRKSSIALVARANDGLLKQGFRRMSTKRPSLATYGRRVSTILGMRKLSNRLINPVVEENPMQVIKELPSEARFSTTFSDEAQFAMLKGYEDVLHRELSFSYPEHQGLLLRNNTPGYPIKVKKSAASEEKPDTEEPKEESKEESKEPVAQSTEEDDDIWENESLGPKKADRRHSNVSGKVLNKGIIDGGMKRARSLPFISKSRSQLVITHRFQSAIDILDTLRKTLGHSTISPRMNRTAIAPVRDFNFWTSAWYSEFTKSTS